jgi:hypothetical protein
LRGQRGGGQKRDEANGIEVKKIPPLVEVREFIHQKQHEEMDPGREKFLRDEQQIDPEAREGEEEENIPGQSREADLLQDSGQA